MRPGLSVTPLEDKPQYRLRQAPERHYGAPDGKAACPPWAIQSGARPSDGKQPDSIAYFQCAASRDETTGIPYCSRVCCMYAIKQAMLLSGSLPITDITVYYMDIRAFGKGYEQFYQNASAMGIRFVKTRPEITGTNAEGNILVRYEAQEEDGRIITTEHDLVVLSLGLVPGWSPAGKCAVSTGSDGFIHTVSPKLSPTLTEMDGVFTAGAACGPKDIVDTISEAGAAAMQASNYLSARAEKPAA